MAQEPGSTLGSRIKRFRENSRLSVRELASQISVSASFIYQLEQDKVSASYSTLKAMARALHTQVGVLAGDEMPAEWFLVRNQDRKRIIGETGTTWELMPFTGARTKRMQPLMFNIEPGMTESDMLYTHEREEFLFVIAGEIEVTMAARVFSLQAGDAMYFMFDRPTAIKNSGSGRATGIFVVSPPSA